VNVVRTPEVRQAGIVHFAMLDDEEDQRLKTRNSRRRIPLHRALVELGFLKLVENRRKSGAARLFPDFPLGEDGYYSPPFSKFFGRFLDSVEAKSEKSSFHSFRHNFEDACRNVDVPLEVMNTLQGHSERGMAARYGKGYVLKKLDEWMRKIRHDDLDLSHLMGKIEGK
jgi:integrase